MKKIIKSLAVIAFTVIAVLAFNVEFVSAHCDDACAKYRNGTAKPDDYDLICGGCDGGNENELMTTVKNVLNAIFGVVGIIAVVMIIISGVKYMTSQGDPGKVQSAKNTLLFSVIGLIIVVSAFAIVNFVLGAIK